MSRARTDGGSVPWSPPHPRDLSAAWLYALVGDLASIPLTLVEYWRSETGSHTSLGMVVVGELLAGHLAAGHVPDVGRAGLAGSLPGLWLSFNVLEAAFGPMEPSWFRAVGIVGAVAMTAFIFFVSGVVGYLGGEVDGRLAVGTRKRSRAIVDG